MFHDHKMTHHAGARIRQRGLRDDDIRLLLKASSQISSEIYLLTEHDAAREISLRKREIQSLERLRGCKIVVEQGYIVTCYHASSKNQKKSLRHGRARQ